MNADVAARAKDFPDLEVAYADAQQDNAKQVADVENFLRQKIDLLIISPNEAQPLTPIVEGVFDQGIPVIVLDRAIEGDTYTTFIGADNSAIGKAAGEYIAQLLNGKGEIVEIKGLPARRPRATGSDGFREAIAAVPEHPDRARPRRELAARGGDGADGVGARRAPAHRPRLRPQRSDGDGRVPRRQGQGPRERDEVRRHRRAAGPRRRPPDGRRRPARGDVRLPTGGKEAVEIAERVLKGEKVPHKIVLQTVMVTKENALAPPAK